MNPRSWPKELLIGLRLTLALAVMVIVYTFVVTGISQVAFNSNANGSLVSVNGKAVGSTMIGQSCPAETIAKDGSLKITIDTAQLQEAEKLGVVRKAQGLPDEGCVKLLGSSLDHEHDPWVRREAELHEVLVERLASVGQPLMQSVPGTTEPLGIRQLRGGPVVGEVLIESEQNLGPFSTVHRH